MLSPEILDVIIFEVCGSLCYRMFDYKDVTNMIDATARHFNVHLDPESYQEVRRAVLDNFTGEHDPFDD